MNDEIKEILDNTLEYLEGIDETRNTKILTTNETNILLDYITNLQEENERLKKLEYKFIDSCGENEDFTLEEYLDIGNKLYDSEREKEDYKSRIENTPLYETTYDYNMEDNLELNYVSDETASNKLLDILNGRSDE